MKIFETLFLSALNIVAPEKSQNVVVKTKVDRMTSTKPWITSDIKAKKLQKKYLWNNYLNCKTANKFDVFKRMRNIVNKTIRISKENFYKTEFAELQSSKKKLAFINDTLQRQNESTSLKTLSYGGQYPMSDPKDIAHHLNQTFVMMGMYNGPDIPYVPSTPKSRYRFQLSFATSDDVRKAIKKLKVRKASGLSAIPTWALRDACSIICYPLRDIINACITQSIFPDALKNAVVTPLYKKGDREDALNYRPISITTNLSKIFERILATQIGTYMNDTQQYSKCQFGFRQKFSTSDALLYCIEKWRKSLDDNQYAVVASLDLSKAFDSIDHDILMTKLEHLGFDNQSTTLLKSFLSGRYQAVKVKDTVSSWMQLIRGVPQGTILGPLLFTLYVNDIIDQINCDVAQYADDTLLFTASADIDEACQKLEQNCSQLVQYFNMHKMQVNVDKTDFIVFKPKQTQTLNDIKLNVQGKTNERSSEIKYLGIFIDDKLNYDKQIKTVVKKMAMGIRSIRFIAHAIPIQARIQLVPV